MNSGLRQWPALQGGLLALFAALLFGASTPFVQLFGSGIGPFTTAGLLYAGAALVGARSRWSAQAGMCSPRDLPRLAAMVASVP